MVTNPNDFRPDSTFVFTGKAAEAELNGFVFNGPGWYIIPESTLLVVPTGDQTQPWKQQWPSDQRFYFYLYDHRNPTDAFNEIVNAPTRLDQRLEMDSGEHDNETKTVNKA